MGADENEDLSPEMMRAAEAMSKLSPIDPPKDLVTRTLALISASYKPVKRVFWLLRPITHPLARIAAAAVIIFSFALMIDMNLADPLGSRIESLIIGRQTADRFEGLLDRVLVREGQSYS